MQPVAPTLVPAARAPQSQPDRFFPSLAMSALSALPAELVARHVAALEDRETQRAALRYQIALGNYVARAAARSIIDRAVASGASGPAVAALIDAQTAAMNTEAKVFEIERSSSDVCRQAYKARTQELRLAVSRRRSSAEREIAVLGDRIRAGGSVKRSDAFDKLAAAGLTREQLVALGHQFDPVAEVRRQCEEHRTRIEALRPVVAACKAFADDPGNYEHLEGLDEFAVLVEAARAVEGEPL